MSKVKEIEVWVDPKEDEFASRVVYVSQFQPRYVKARLIIDLPEKKIELTESELDEAIEAFFKMYRKDQYVTAQDIEHRCSRFKQKLFGGEA